jgi:phosphatidylglycerophosphatase A
MRSLGQRIKRFIIVGLASGGYLSYVPVWLIKDRQSTGAGLIGSFWGVFLLSRLPLERGKEILVWVAALAMSIAVSDAAEEILGNKDDQRIVIDEFIGYWTAMLFLPRSLLAVSAAFILFRLFDTWKPAGIRQLGHLPGGWGVVADDIAAGAAANVLVRLLSYIHPL